MKSEFKNSVRKEWFRRGLLAVLLLAAGILWLTEGKQQSAPPSPSPVPTVYRDERLKRETAYDRDVAALQALLEGGAADTATQEMAAQKLVQLVEEHQHEIALENALLEAGYQNAVVLIQNGAVTVMVPQEKLNDTTSIQILSLCVAHAGVNAENVRVMGQP